MNAAFFVQCWWRWTFPRSHIYVCKNLQRNHFISAHFWHFESIPFESTQNTPLFEMILTQNSLSSFSGWADWVFFEFHCSLACEGWFQFEFIQVHSLADSSIIRRVHMRLCSFATDCLFKLFSATMHNDVLAKADQHNKSDNVLEQNFPSMICAFNIFSSILRALYFSIFLIPNSPVRALFALSLHSRTKQSARKKCNE